MIGIGRRLLCAICAGAIPAAGGCAEQGRQSRFPALTPSPQPYESDIPLPQGFALVERSSEDWSAGPHRYVRHRYRGRADKHAVRMFYREQMPLVRWTALAESHLHGRYTLRFERGGESCTINVTGGNSSLFPRTIVDVIIGPTVRRE